jgi:hypothetical protein
MKNFLVLVIAVLLHVLIVEELVAQETGDKEKMKVFDAWIGRWQGESSMQMGPGEPRKATMDETIQSKLDGMILVVEGIGKAPHTQTKEDIVVHHAFAILSYDKASGQYKFKTYLKDGRSADAWLTVSGANTFAWGFDIPGRGKMRYTITLDPGKKTWHETGEFSADGTQWNKFFEMNLKKVD